jgi:hypothetical protein
MSLFDFIKYKRETDNKPSAKKVEDLFVIPKISNNTNIVDSDLNL